MTGALATRGGALAGFAGLVFGWGASIAATFTGLSVFWRSEDRGLTQSDAELQWALVVGATGFLVAALISAGIGALRGR